MSRPDRAASAAALVVIGSELLTGTTIDLNTSSAARILAGRGITLSEVRIVPDSQGAIIHALRDLEKVFSLIVVTGGLGPTEDDLTAYAVAEAFHRAMTRSAEVERIVRTRYRDQGRSVPEPALTQAEMPESAVPVENPAGTAPGFVLRTERDAAVIAVPGFPREVSALLPLCLDISGRTPTGPERKPVTLRTWGIPESELSSIVGDLLEGGTSGIAFLPHYGRVDLVFSPEPGYDRMFNKIKEQIAGSVYGTDPDVTLEMLLGDSLRDLGLTLALAESCTGGLIGSLLTEAPGASDWFSGGVISYSDTAKTALLGVDPTVLSACGAVSEETAMAMARGVVQATGSDIGASVTGIAGPSGAVPGKPVGTVCMAVVSGSGECSVTRHVTGPRTVVRRVSASYLLGMILRHLGGETS